MAALYRQGRLLVAACERDEAARRRAARALTRAAALDPDHALAHAVAARLLDDRPAAARAIERWPGVTAVRWQRFAARFARGEHEDLLEDAAALHAADPDQEHPRGVLAVLRAGQGDLAGAWAVVAPVVDADSPPPRLLDVALQVATGRRDAVGAEQVRRRIEAMEAARAVAAALRHEVWAAGDLAGLERRWRDLPRDGEYWAFRAELALQASVPRDALVSFGRYLLVASPDAPPPAPAPFLMVAHSYGFNPLQRREVVEEDLAAAAREAPLDPAPRLALAAYLSSAAHRAEVDADERAALAQAAAAQAAHAAALDADARPGPSLLLASCLIDAGHLVEARAALDVAEAAEGRRTDLVAFLRARLAAARGDAAAAAAALRELNADPRTRDSVYRFSADPAFTRVRDDARFALPAGWPPD
ncbi:MAG: hypothetical protein M9894_02085 [Planctomycetes bacterium]|nr:hypothetical protein [Planctomycetota bacterium]